MAKKVTKRLGSAKKVSKLFYATADKYKRAVKMVDSKEYKSVKEAYTALGGTFSEGHGYMPV